MKSFWNGALAIGGTATVGAFILWSIYKQWLLLKIFPQLTQDQAFSLFRYLIILTFAAFVILTIVQMLRHHVRSPNSSHIFALHSSWHGVNEIDPAMLIGPDVTNAVRALDITAKSWLEQLVPKQVIIDSHFEDFEILFQALVNCKKIVPGFEKKKIKCSDLITDNMRKAHQQMITYNNKHKTK